MSRATAVVVHWRDADDTRGCVESLAAEPELDLVVVDNGSHPPLAPFAARLPVTYVRSEENLGYAGGANLGFDAALARLISEPETRAALAARGRERAGHFTWEATARRTRQVYEEAVA